MVESYGSDCNYDHRLHKNGQLCVAGYMHDDVNLHQGKLGICLLNLHFYETDISCVCAYSGNLHGN